MLYDNDVIDSIKLSKKKPLYRWKHIWKFTFSWNFIAIYKSKGLPRQAVVALGVPGRLRHRIFLTFGTTGVVGRQPNAPATFTPGEIPGTHFQRLSQPQSTWFCRKEPRRKSQVTPLGIDPGTVRLVAQRLNHYGTPGPIAVYTIWMTYVCVCACIYIYIYVISVSLYMFTSVLHGAVCSLLSFLLHDNYTT